jgi:hypothetical protein
MGLFLPKFLVKKKGIIVVVVKAYNKMHASLTFHLILGLGFRVLILGFKIRF